MRCCSSAASVGGRWSLSPIFLQNKCHLKSLIDVYSSRTIYFCHKLGKRLNTILTQGCITCKMSKCRDFILFCLFEEGKQCCLPLFEEASHCVTSRECMKAYYCIGFLFSQGIVEGFDRLLSWHQHDWCIGEKFVILGNQQYNYICIMAEYTQFCLCVWISATKYGILSQDTFSENGSKSGSVLPTINAFINAEANQALAYITVTL